MRHRITWAMGAWLLWTLALQAQPFSPPARPPSPAPLLFVQFAEPAGMSVTLYQGRAQPRKLTTPFTVGLRPGYVYRMKLSDIPNYPGVVLAPTLDVRGSLFMPSQVSASRHPAPFVLRERDLRNVLANGVVTELVYIEDPEIAPPVPGNPGELLAEAEVPLARDLLQESRQYGRPLFGWRLGSHSADDAELAAQSIQGTILFPGENFLPQPTVKPYVPFGCIPYYDPILGPARPHEECIADGGAGGTRPGINGDGSLYGLTPSATVAEYSDSRGGRHVTVSNRVCICAPRFAALRNEMNLGATTSLVGPGSVARAEGQVGIHAALPSLTARQSEAMVGLLGRERPSANINQEGLIHVTSRTVLIGIELPLGPFALLGTERINQLTQEQKFLIIKQMELAQSLSVREGLAAVAGREGTFAVGQVQRLAGGSQVVTTRDLTLTCEEIRPSVPEQPLVLRKWVQEHEAKVGDVVTFFLRYSNAGGQPISDVAVSDSLAGRLEYVPGSSKTDRPAIFTTQQNEAGSVILRWEIQGPLPAGENGTVSFQVRVR